MTTNTVVADEQLGQLGRKYHDLFRRVREGTLPIEQVLAGMQSLIEGHFDPVAKGLRLMIDCDARPHLPDGWSIKPEDQLTNVVCGQIEFDPAKVAFHLDSAQKKGVIVGNDLKKKLAGKTVYGAQVLDHLLANTNLIPESWKVDEQGRTRYTFFWGTIYRGSSGDLYVRYLDWRGGKWDWSYSWLVSYFDDRSPAAVSAS